jgi:hypothetical protein
MGGAFGIVGKGEFSDGYYPIVVSDSLFVLNEQGAISSMLGATVNISKV